VNAPLTCPKRSLSSKSGGTASISAKMVP
jgi:hypothetical protein